MLTLLEVEERHDKIKLRLDEIIDLIRTSKGDPVELAEEIAILIFEAKTLRANLRYHQEMAEVLASCACVGGPH
jgi:hypothetical protein